MKVKLGDLTKIRTGKLDANASSPNGKYPFFTCSKEPLRINSHSYDCECVLVAGNGDLNVKYYNGKFDAYQRTYIIEDNGSNQLYMPYLYYFMEGYVEELRKLSIGGVIKYIKLGNLTEALIELPKIEDQRTIVDILNKSKRILSYHQQQLQKLDDLVKARFVEMFGMPVSNPKHWKTEKMNRVAPAVNYSGVFDDAVWLLNLDMVESQTGRILNYLIVSKSEIGNSTCAFDTSNVLYSKLRPYLNKVVIPDRCGFATSELVPLQPVKEKINREYLAFMLRSDEFVNTISEKVAGAKMPRVSMSDFRSFDVPIPPYELQMQFTDFVHQVDKSKLSKYYICRYAYRHNS